MIGKPHKITTVDKYQGQQNDYIILSLVRTFTVGHLRDVRRLVRFISSPIGIIYFGKSFVVSKLFRINAGFNILCKRPQKLLIVPNEAWPTQRNTENENLPMEPIEIEDMPHMAQFVYEFYRANENTIKNMWLETQGMVEGGVGDERIEEPYEGGKIKVRPTVGVEQARKEEGTRLEKDIEFEILADEQTPAAVPPAEEAAVPAEQPATDV